MGSQRTASRAHCEDVVLVQTLGKLLLPHMAAAELVVVATFRHQNVPRSEFESSNIADRNLNFCDVIECEITVLDIGHPQVRPRCHCLSIVSLAQRQTCLEAAHRLQGSNLPVRRDLAQPLDAGVLHGDVRVEAPGDGAGDEGGALLLKQLDQPLLPRHQRIDLRRLAVEEGDDGLLLLMRRQGYDKAPPLIHADRFCTMGGRFHHRSDDPTGEAIQRPCEVEGVDTVDQSQRFHVLVDGHGSRRHCDRKAVRQYHPPHDDENDLRGDELDARFIPGLL